MSVVEESVSPTSSQDNSVSYWKEKLTNISPINLPADYIRPAVPNSSVAKIDFTTGRSCWRIYNNCLISRE